MNKFLFGLIGILFLAIVVVGGVTVMNMKDSYSNPTPSSSGNSYQPGSISQPTKIQTPTPGTFTFAQVRTHNSASSCYTTIHGSVYDVTSWIDQHPGGAQAILSLCGTDGSAAFDAQHGGQRRPEAELASFKIGTLIP